MTLFRLPGCADSHGAIDLMALTQNAQSARAIAIYCCADCQAVSGNFPGSLPQVLKLPATIVHLASALNI